MFLPLSDRARELLDQVMAFMDEHVYPNEARFHEEIASGDRWQPVSGPGGGKGHRARAGPVEPVPAGERARRGPRQLRVRPSL